MKEISGVGVMTTKTLICQLCKRPFHPAKKPGTGMYKGKFCSLKCYWQSLRGKRLSPQTEFKKGQTPFNFKRPSRDELDMLYSKEGLSTSEIAEIYKVNVSTVKRWLGYYKIPTDPNRRPRTWRENIKRTLLKLWEQPEYREHMSEAHKRPEAIQKSIENLRYRPTSLERKLMKIIRKYDLPYIYTGNGSFWIGRLNPDFINNNGAKVAIEVFGDYWHGRLDKKGRIRSEIPYWQTLEGRREMLKKYGWELRVIWEHELQSLPEEEIVRRLM